MESTESVSPRHRLMVASKLRGDARRVIGRQTAAWSCRAGSQSDVPDAAWNHPLREDDLLRLKEAARQ
jgi:hypothetical protein